MDMKKMLFGNYLLCSLIGTAGAFGGCSNSSETTADKRALNEGIFVSVFEKKVQYKCDNKITALSDNSQFACQTFPIVFYSDNIKLGEINSIHEDGYVFPQDIIMLEESSATYSSNEEMRR